PQAAFRSAIVLNYGVGTTRTTDWVSRPVSPFLCGFASLYPLVAYACPRAEPLGAAGLPSLPRTPDLILIVLGTNHAIDGISPAETVDNLARLRDMLAPSPVVLAPPFPRTLDTPDAPNLVPQVRDLGIASGLFTGPDWPPLPLVDGLHLTNGAYA